MKLSFYGFDVPMNSLDTNLNESGDVTDEETLVRTIDLKIFLMIQFPNKYNLWPTVRYPSTGLG